MCLLSARTTRRKLRRPRSTMLRVSTQLSRLLNRHVLVHWSNTRSRIPILDVLRRRTVRRIIRSVVLRHRGYGRISVPLLGRIRTLIGIWVVGRWLLLLSELGFSICVASSDSGRRLRWIRGSHGSAALLCCGAVPSATQDEEDYGSDEGEAEESAHDCAGY